MKSQLNRKYVVAALAAVLVAVVGIVIYPKIAGDSRAVQSVNSSSLCEEHGVPEKICPFCHPGLIKKMGSCQEHGVPEALCYQCNFDLVAGFQAQGDWCKAHSVPESQCPL